MSRYKGLPLRWCLMAFGAALLVPVLVFAAVPLWQYAGSERSRYEEEAREAARRAIAAVDRELTGIQAAAQALATSPLIAGGDFEAFQRQALEALRAWAPEEPDVYAIVLRDLTGQQLVNTRVPWGTPLPRVPGRDIDRLVVETKRPQVQDVFASVSVSRPIVSVRVPVLREGEVTHVLSMALEPKRIAEVLRTQGIPSGWTSAVIDRNDRIVARSQQSERFTGTLATEDLRRSAVGDEGLWSGTTLEGTPVLGAYARSQLSGWRAAVGVPLSLLQEPFRRWLWTVTGLGVAALVLSFVLAAWFGRRIARSIQALETSADRLGKGEAVSFVATGLREIDSVGRALALAATELREREAALRASEGRLRATHENAAVGILELDRDGRILRVNQAHCRLMGRSRDDLVGRKFVETTHADDRDRDWDLFRRQVEGEYQIYTIEKRHVRGDGTAGWARVSSTAVRDGAGRFLYAVRVVEDITERKRAEIRQKLLVDELNHRVKNTLATVQSLAWQSLRQDQAPQDARECFESRLIALSRTHDLLNRSSWEGATLKEVLDIELDPYRSDGGSRIVLRGPELRLSPRTTLALGLLFHELATNAAKYGALSVPEGRVEVSWDVTGTGPLRIEWREVGGPPVRPPERTGFGSRLAERTVARELGGRVRFDFEPAGLRCVLEIPADCFARHADPLHG